MLSKARKLEEKEFSLRVGNGESISAEIVGKARLVLKNKFLLFDNVYFILNISINLILVFELYKQLFTISFNNNEIVILRNDLHICSAILEYGLYVLHPFETQNLILKYLK